MKTERIQCRPVPPKMSTLAQTNGPWSANVDMCFQLNRREAQYKSFAPLTGPSYSEAHCTNSGRYFSSLGCLRGLVPGASFTCVASGIRVRRLKLAPNAASGDAYVVI